MLNDDVIHELRHLTEARERLIRLGELYPDLEIERVRWCTRYCARSANASVDRLAFGPVDGAHSDLVASFSLQHANGDEIHAVPHSFVVASHPRRGVLWEHPNWASHMRAVEIPESMIAQVAAKLAKLGATPMAGQAAEPTRLAPEDAHEDLCLLVATSSGEVYHDNVYVDRKAMGDDAFTAILRRAETVGITLRHAVTGPVLTDACQFNRHIDLCARELQEGANADDVDRDRPGRSSTKLL